MNFRFRIAIAVTLVAAILFSCDSDKSGSEKTEKEAQAKSDKPTIETNPLKEAYFGETHVHTSTSMDAFHRRKQAHAGRRLPLRTR